MFDSLSADHWQPCDCPPPYANCPHPPSGRDECDWCDGSGDSEDGLGDCSACDGTGVDR